MEELEFIFSMMFGFIFLMVLVHIWMKIANSIGKALGISKLITLIINKLKIYFS